MFSLVAYIWNFFSYFAFSFLFYFMKLFTNILERAIWPSNFGRLLSLGISIEREDLQTNGLLFFFGLGPCGLLKWAWTWSLILLDSVGRGSGYGSRSFGPLSRFQLDLGHHKLEFLDWCEIWCILTTYLTWSGLLKKCPLTGILHASGLKISLFVKALYKLASLGFLSCHRCYCIRS